MKACASTWPKAPSATLLQHQLIGQYNVSNLLGVLG
jgi:hypothetical protein